MNRNTPKRQPKRSTCRGSILLGALVVICIAGGLWFWLAKQDTPKQKGPGAVPVTSGVVTSGNFPVRLTANGTVTPVQSVDVRAQLSATVRTVHVKEGQFVRQGERLFSLDVRTEDANLGKAEAQLSKSRADLANAERNLKRQRDLFAQKFISQTALDTVQNQVDSLRAQTEADAAALEASRVTRSLGDIASPIAGRIGAITVYPGSLVQPSGAALVSITQIDPINISFTLPERELPALQASVAKGNVAVNAQVEDKTLEGRLSFIDNSVDSASGTIRLKASFPNRDGQLWPGMFVNVSLSPRTLTDALTVPAQAVQTGPEKKFLYLIGDEGKISVLPVRLLLIQDGQAVIEGDGLKAGLKMVVEGAQNLRPGSTVNDAPKKSAADSPDKADKAGKSDKPGKQDKP
jgi:RND family efflux transporter MFP subunit